MILVGLTGGIGSGKSTVSALLAERGAVVVDADAITRELQQAGSPLLAKLAEAFGDGILGADGELDRAGLAAIVFNDAEALKSLNAIVHPAVGAEIARRIAQLATTDQVVVLDVPLLTENPRDNLQGKIVIDVPVEVQVERLIDGRGFSEADARARIAHQASRELRLRGASVVVDNSGHRDALPPQVDAVWTWLSALPQLPHGYDYLGDGGKVHLRRAIPALPVTDMERALEHYRDRLGCAVIRDERGVAVLRREDVELHLWQANDTSWTDQPHVQRPVSSGAESVIAGTASCRVEVEVDDVELLFALIAGRGVLHSTSAGGPVTTNFGSRQFHTVDPDNNVVTFFQHVEITQPHT